MNGYDGDAISESELCGDEERDADELIAVTQKEWSEIHDCTFCGQCELRAGCQAEEKKRRAVDAKKGR